MLPPLRVSCSLQVVAAGIFQVEKMKRCYTCGPAKCSCVSDTGAQHPPTTRGGGALFRWADVIPFLRRWWNFFLLPLLPPARDRLVVGKLRDCGIRRLRGGNMRPAVTDKGEKDNWMNFILPLHWLVK